MMVSTEHLLHKGCSRWVLALATLLVGCDQTGTHITDGVRAPSQETSQPSEPTVQSDFDADGVVRLGYIEPGSAHELTYVLHAPEHAAITDLGIDTDCPCIQALWLPTKVELGQPGVVRSLLSIKTTSTKLL